MFKIVQTKESGSKKLTIIPQAWEKNERLKWPKSGSISQTKFNKLLMDPNSVPPVEWNEYKCTLKRANLSMADAKLQLNEMFAQSDTHPSSDSEMMKPPPSQPQSIAKRMNADKKKHVEVANFQKMVCAIFY